MSDWTPETGYQEALRRIEKCRKKREKDTLLDLRNLSLKSLPPEIGELSALTELRLWGNQLTSLPLEIGQLSALLLLPIGRNELTSLPPEIGKLSALTVLDLQDNQLTSLPLEIGQLSALTELNLRGNKLTSLPLELGQLTALTRLNLGGNELTSLPPEIGQLAALTLLNLGGNELTSLPPDLQKLKKLTHFFAHWNPALGLKAEALGPDFDEVYDLKKPPKPPQDIFSIYFAQQSSGTKALNEVKIILVGRGGAGKTSIRKRLIEDRFDLEQQETPGIEIDHWELERKKDGIIAHVWDFAGQDITHATHQFFLTRRSLYLLVLEGRQDSQDRDAEYWLRLIRAFGADSPVIVVLNKWDEKPFAVSDFTLRQEFPQIRGFIRTDCRTGLGMVELKQTLRETATAMETVKQEFPRLWFSVKEEMAGMVENYLPLCEYREICLKHGVTAREDQDALAGYLHDLGIILHYADDERLADTTVLNPRWVTASVYTLLRHVDKRQKGDGKFTGNLTLAEASGVLADTDAKMVKYLVGLMERFELCYPLEGKEETWLIPQLLSPQTPQNLGDKWFKEKATRLRYRFNVLPEGLLPRFIVRAHPLISENLVWRQGVVLEMDDEVSGETARALAIAEPGKERIQVTVIGAKAARLRLTKLVRAHFQDIHQDFNQSTGNGGKQVNNLNARELMELEDKPGIFKSIKALLVDEKKGNVSTISTDEEGSMRIDQKQELDRVAAPEGKERMSDLVASLLPARPKVFLSYAHHDTAYRDVFAQNLTLMEADGIIDWWHDGRLLAGEDFDGKIRLALVMADVIIIFLSTASLGSKYIREVELRYAKEAAERFSPAPLVVPILLEKDCNWKSANLGHLQTIPSDGKGTIKAVDQWPSRRKAFNAVEQALRKLLLAK